MSRQSRDPRPRRRATRWCPYKGRCVLVEWLGQTKAQNSSSITFTPACEMLDGVASSVVRGITGAFFMSLKLCSCIYLDTKDGPVEPSLLPFIRDRRRLQQDAGAEDKMKCGGGAKPSCFCWCWTRAITICMLEVHAVLGNVICKYLLVNDKFLICGSGWIYRLCCRI